MSAYGESRRFASICVASRFLHINPCLERAIPLEQAMLTETYIETLLVDEELADQIWEAWDAREIDDQVACVTWWYISKSLTPDIDLGAYGKQFN